MPKTHEELKNWVVKKSKETNYLLLTDVAKDVYDIIAGGPVPKHIKPIWPFISFTAFHTLPDEFKNDKTIDIFTAYKRYIKSKPWAADNYLRDPSRKPEWVS